MDDDVEIGDDCPKCGHFTYWQPCRAFCDDGWFDEYEDDAINFSPGESYERCSECDGHGYAEWCPNCGWDVVFGQYLNGRSEVEKAGK